ncbi:hypothetical protein MRX96_008521 [Rhipicephalus microplus]
METYVETTTRANDNSEMIRQLAGSSEPFKWTGRFGANCWPMLPDMLRRLGGGLCFACVTMTIRWETSTSSGGFERDFFTTDYCFYRHVASAVASAGRRGAERA